MSKFSPEDLFAFRLAPHVLNSLELMYFDSSTVEEVSPHEQLEEEVKTPSTTTQNKDRDFYKSDLYRFNLKREGRGMPPISEKEFEELAGGLNESISASEAESDSEAENIYHGKQDALETIFEKSIQKLEKLELEENDGIVSHLATRSPYILFKSALLEDNMCFGVFKSLFNIKEIEDPINALKSWQSSTSKKSAIFMIGGGHFAGAIVSHTPKSVKGQLAKAGQDILDNSVDFIEHKSFHRYTTRRKQGGSQSAMDNAKGKANSAGSTLRRANEMALQNEVRELIQSWKKHLDQCDSIFIRANGVQNRRILIGYEGSPLKTNDDRIRSFPFTTKRATTSELKKAWNELTLVAITTKPKTDDKKLKQKLVQEQLKQSQLQKEKIEEQITPEEKHTREIVTFLKKSRGPVLVAYMKKNSLPPNFQLVPEAEFYHTPTVLHYASANGIKNLIGVLLKTLKCDPSVLNKAGKTPYDLCANTSVKQAFRVVRSEMGESSYDWESAHVESPLTREDVEAAELEKKQQEEDEKKQLQREELSKRVDPLSGPKQRLNGISLSQANINSLSDDQRLRLMREQRARAAEARMKLQQSK